MKAVREEEQETADKRRRLGRAVFEKQIEDTKTLTKLALAAVMLSTAFAAQADWVSGHFRSNGTYVMPYYRTPANGIPYDNLSYRGYPSQQPGYVSPRAWSSDSDLSRPKTMPSYGSSRFQIGLLPNTGDYAPKPLNGRSRSSSLGH